MASAKKMEEFKWNFYLGAVSIEISFSKPSTVSESYKSEYSMRTTPVEALQFYQYHLESFYSLVKRLLPYLLEWWALPLSPTKPSVLASPYGAEVELKISCYFLFWSTFKLRAFRKDKNPFYEHT